MVLPLSFGELHTEARFHVINSNTSYKALLGRPWLQEYGIVPSTLHQCMKYNRDNEEHRIDGDEQPFLVHEVKIYDDAKYFIAKNLKDGDLPRIQAATPDKGKMIDKGKNK